MVMAGPWGRGLLIILHRSSFICSTCVSKTRREWLKKHIVILCQMTNAMVAFLNLLATGQWIDVLLNHAKSPEASRKMRERSARYANHAKSRKPRKSCWERFHKTNCNPDWHFGPVVSFCFSVHLPQEIATSMGVLPYLDSWKQKPLRLL